MAMQVSVRLFAVLRECAGRDSVDLELDQGATVAEAIDRLRREPGLKRPLSEMSVAAAVNREYASPETVLSANDELALVPPVSGGEGIHPHARVTAEPLSIEQVTDQVKSPGAGAVVVFQGSTRDVERLDYEAYVEMAEERIAMILRECVGRHGLEAAAAEHRTGTVPLGEPSVIVAVSAAHRDEAFAGAREVIDRIKDEAPIWKREISGDTELWAAGSPAPRATSPTPRRAG
jgi:molybdopterin synthase catalytic subunit